MRSSPIRRALAALPLLIAGLFAPDPGRASPAWSPCPEDPVLECASIPVPVDWADPTGATFDLALARRKATGPGPRVGSLVVNPGGPGNSGVDWLRRFTVFSPQVTARFDVIGFDPRGVGRSSPVRCSPELLAAEPHPLINDQAAFEARLAYNGRRRADCRARTGPLFDHLDSVSVARDLEAVRAALGEEKLTFYGASYGTLIAQHYAELFPERIRALVLDGVVDHTLDTRRFLTEEAAAVEDGLEQFTRWCARDRSCALHGRDLRALWENLWRRASRGDLGDITPFALSRLAFRGFYNPASWPQLAGNLDALDSGRKAAPALDTFPYQVFCQDFAFPVRDHRQYAELLRKQARRAPQMRYSTLALEQVAMCLGQPLPLPNPQRPARIPADGPPLLLLNSRHDPATTHPWAVRVARQMGRRAHLLTYEGSGHAVYVLSACAREAADAYLLAPLTPLATRRCPPS